MAKPKPSNELRGADFSNKSPLYQTDANAGAVLRRPLHPQDLKDDPELVASDQQFAELLIDLAENYNIYSPSLALFQKTDRAGNPEVFIEGQWVEGKNLSDHASEIPAPVVRQALEAIMRYYRDVDVNGGPYLSDLRPSNIIYGKMNGDEVDRLYFVDLEPIWEPAGRTTPFLVSMDRVLPELWLMVEEGMRNGESWQDLRDSLAELDKIRGF